MVKRLEICLTPVNIDSVEKIKQLVLNKLELGNEEKLMDIIAIRKSIDARSRQPVIRLMVDVYINEKFIPKPTIVDNYKIVKNNNEVIIVGA
ncbi:hypothetical protein OAK19_06400, partial [Aureispira]|nr:hypothetical protein [Aureispira sp.]